MMKSSHLFDNIIAPKDVLSTTYACIFSSSPVRLESVESLRSRFNCRGFLSKE